jgi:hypothetical protein
LSFRILCDDVSGSILVFAKDAVLPRQSLVFDSRLGVPQDDPLVQFFTLEKMKLEPMPYEDFQMTPSREEC